MILEIWTILNPIIKTLIYLTALYSIGSVLFKFHFQQYFNKEISLYCRKIIKSNSLLIMLEVGILMVCRKKDSQTP